MIYPQGPRGETERRAAGQASADRSGRSPDARFDQRGDMRTTASVHTLHAFGRRSDRPESRSPSVGRRIFRAFTRFVVTLLIGIGATLAWQSYGEVAREMAAARAPNLARLLPPTGWPASSTAAQQPAAYNLETLRLNIEQLAARQDLMAQSFATLLAVEMDIRQKMAFTPASAVAIPAPNQPAAPAQSYRPAQARTQSSSRSSAAQ